MPVGMCGQKNEKLHKVNYIKCWLQKFGDRDNETFNARLTIGEITWELSMQYDYDDDGDQIVPNDWCTSGFKHVHNNSISDRSEEELDQMIVVLKESKQWH